MNALLGSVNTILAVSEEEGVRATVTCFGPDAAAYRVELYPAYHAHRPPVPDDLAHQFERAPGLFGALGWGVSEHDRARGGRRDGRPRSPEEKARGYALVLTGDRDMFQCGHASA